MRRVGVDPTTPKELIYSQPHLLICYLRIKATSGIRTQDLKFVQYSRKKAFNKTPALPLELKWQKDIFNYSTTTSVRG